MNSLTDQLNNQSNTGGGFWSSILGAATELGSSYLSGKSQSKGQPSPTAAANTTTTNWGLIAAIGAGVLLVVGLVILKK